MPWSKLDTFFATDSNSSSKMEILTDKLEPFVSKAAATLGTLLAGLDPIEEKPRSYVFEENADGLLYELS
jgi:glutathione synthase/RimK-type ligase-like ATP-grasp enzyme